MYGFPINLIVLLFPSIKRRVRPPQPCRKLPPLSFQQYHPRVAHLVPEYRHDPASARFADIYSPELAQFRPQVLYGTGGLLCRLARAIEAGHQIRIPIHYGIVVQHRTLDDLLTPAQRDLLWRVFQVPLYEQISTAHGMVLASECEAHQGLHIADQRVSRAAGPRQVISETCACGTGGLRLIPFAASRTAPVVEPEPIVAPLVREPLPVEPLTVSTASSDVAQAC